MILFNQDDYTLELDLNLDKFKEELSKIRTGKASVSIFQKIMVNVYGSQMPLSSVAKVIVDGPLAIKLEVWDKSNIEEVMNSLSRIDLGAKVSQEGSLIRVNFIALTQEDKRDKIEKVIPKLLNEFLSRIRDVRRNFNEKVKSLEKVSEDDKEESFELIQKILKEYEQKFEDLSKEKKVELLSI